jgi:energy-coupling factor transporter transmembrane protein EcfT
MELVTFLSRIKVPTKIAIALGVGFRYFGLLANDIKRINFVQSLNGYGFHYQAIKKNGIVKTTISFLLPVFLNILKQSENISISISIQNIELRTINFKFSKTTFIEFCLTAISLLIILYRVLLYFFW